MLTFAHGCGPKVEAPPGLKPVGGIVQTADGKPLVTGGMIEFTRVDDRTNRATSAIRNDGRFELQTAQTNAKHIGVLPGDYEVVVYPAGAGAMDALGAEKPVTVPPEGAQDLTVTVRKLPQ